MDFYLTLCAKISTTYFLQLKCPYCNRRNSIFVFDWTSKKKTRKIKLHFLNWIGMVIMEVFNFYGWTSLFLAYLFIFSIEKVIWGCRSSDYMLRRLWLLTPWMWLSVTQKISKNHYFRAKRRQNLHSTTQTVSLFGKAVKNAIDMVNTSPLTLLLKPQIELDIFHKNISCMYATIFGCPNITGVGRAYYQNRVPNL